LEEARSYLDDKTKELEKDGVQAETHLLALNEIAFSIDEAARVFEADIIACATHGRSAAQRLLRGGVAWRAVAHSSVPVMMRHFEAEEEADRIPLSPRRMLVPLDGSELAEAALPIAAQLAQEWKAEVWLAQVVHDMQAPNSPYRRYQMLPVDNTTPRKEAQAYLDEKAKSFPGSVHTGVFVGGVIDTLSNVANEWAITHVVMATHGRTGLSRVILGSVADGLVHRLSLPIVIVPALAVHAHTETIPSKEEVPAGS
jgi:nucleotide-binding universal stress UspA family protein